MFSYVKYTFKIVLIILILLSNLHVGLLKGNASTFSSGAGTIHDPYIIMNAAQFNSIRHNPSAHYELGRDIDLSAYSWSTISQFSGSINGAGYKITGLRSSGLGLISTLSSIGVILNVHFENVRVGNSSQSWSGALIRINNGAIINTSVSGELIGSNYIGGLVFENKGTISSSYTDIQIIGDSYIGGLVAFNDGTISNSYAKGNIGGSSFLGGLVYRNTGTISNSYAVGRVPGTHVVGGLVGTNSGTIRDSYYDRNTTGRNDTGKGVPKTTEEMRQQSTFSGWDFNTIWTIDEGIDYPKHIEKFKPEVTTSNENIVNPFSATVGGSVVDDGRDQITERGIVFSTHSTPTIANGTKVTTPGTTGEFTLDLTGLTPETTYYYRVFAVNSIGTTYGNIHSFETDQEHTAPILDVKKSTLTSTNENTVSSAERISDIVGNEGIAITEVNGNGTWQYSTDGLEWFNVGAVSPYQSLLLRDEDFIRYVPDSANGETANIRIRAWNQTSGVVGTKVDTTSNGLYTPFSTAETDITILVENVNDAPVLTPTNPMLNPIREDEINNQGQTVSSIIGTSITDIDNGAVKGIAVTSSTGNGTWEYSLDSGVTWQEVGMVSVTNSRLLRDIDLVRYVPQGNHESAPTISYRAWDQTVGTAGDTADTTVNGETTAFSTEMDTASILIIRLVDAEPPLITTQPNEVTVTVGATSPTLSIDVSTRDGGTISYQWYSNSINSTIGGQAISGATSESLTVPTNSVGTTYYYVVVTNTNTGLIGNQTASITSNVVRVTVRNNGNVGGSYSPQDPTSITRRIQPEQGGDISFQGVTVTIPPFAFDHPFNLTIKKKDNLKREWQSTVATRVSDIFEITKDKKGEFSKPVTITLQSDLSKVNQELQEVAVYWLQEEAGEWIQLENIEVNWSAGRVSGKTNHFTKFAVLVTEKQQPVLNSRSILNLKDINGHWAENNINTLVSKGAIIGYPNGTFRPNNTITRAEFTTILVKSLDLQSTDYHSFSDTRNHWAQDSISTAHTQGIIQGYEDGRFRPNEQITREQMAKMIVNALKLEGNSTTTFKDQTTISSWAIDYINIAAEHGIINGYEDGTVKSRNKATRAEAVTFIIRALGSK